MNFCGLKGIVDEFNELSDLSTGTRTEPDAPRRLSVAKPAESLLICDELAVESSKLYEVLLKSGDPRIGAGELF